MPSSIKLTEPLDILVEYGYLDDETPYHKAVSNAVVDFTDDKTLGGEYNKDYVMLLQDEAKKELKARRKKIDVKSFKENFLNKKEEPVKADTTGESSLDFYKPPADDLDLSVEKEEEKETEGLKGIRDIIDDILKVLRLDFKDDRKEARDARKAKLAADRKAKEDKLEGGGLKKSLGIIGKSVGAMLSPFQKIWNALIKFLQFTLLGILFNKTLGWFSDPKNKEKAERIGKFFKDWWPALATAAALWLTPLGGLLNGVVGLLTAIIPKLVMAIAANPYAALAVIGTGVTIYGISKLAGELSLPDKAVNESVEDVGKQETISTLSVEYDEKLLEFQESRNIFRKAFLNEKTLLSKKRTLSGNGFLEIKYGSAYAHSSVAGRVNIKLGGTVVDYVDNTVYASQDDNLPHVYQGSFTNGQELIIEEDNSADTTIITVMYIKITTDIMYTAVGGGVGGRYNSQGNSNQNWNARAGINGGCGGGAANYTSHTGFHGISIQPTYSNISNVSGFGFDGGQSLNAGYPYFGGGGGGAVSSGGKDENGDDATFENDGGKAIVNTFRDGTNIYYAGGGGGAGQDNDGDDGDTYGITRGGLGGGTVVANEKGGGGNGEYYRSDTSTYTAGSTGSANTGGGGGGRRGTFNNSPAGTSDGYAGGSGIVVIRYAHN